MTSTAVRAGHRLITGVCALLLAACAGTPTVTDGSSPGPPSTEPVTTSTESSEDPTTETFDNPETEDPDVTEDAEAGNGGVNVELPGLPIGGNAEVDPTDPTWRCAVVNWTGSPEQPPAEVNVTLTALAVAPAGVYEIIDGGCSDLGPCLDRPGVLTGGQCAVAVRQVSASPGHQGELRVTTGTISCAAEAVALCEQFQVDLAENGATLPGVTWSDALTEWPVTNDDDGTDDDGTDDDGTDDGGTDENGTDDDGTDQNGTPGDGSDGGATTEGP